MRQYQALEILLSGKSVYLAGGPGTGKSTLIRQFMQRTRRNVALTASTGIAATNIGGQTIHSWSGIGARQTLDVYAIRNGPAGRRIRSADTLVIDEISMLSGDTLQAVDDVCRGARGAWGRPFGGLQVILVGDFFQLPPVINKANKPRFLFAFDAPVWKALDPAICYLTHNYRQDNDPEFQALLASIRRNECDPGDCRLHYRLFERDEIPGSVPHLDTHNDRVNALNAVRLANLPGASATYRMTSEGNPYHVAALMKGCQSPDILSLKDGATMIFTRNDPDGRFVNGTTGVIADARGAGGWPVVELKDGAEVTAEPASWFVDDLDEEQERYVRRATITQVPLRLAWGITVHKSQGMSLDAAVMDLSASFEYGQGYVGLSRVRSLDGLYLLGWNARALQVHPQVLAKDFEFRAASEALEALYGRAEFRQPHSGALSSTAEMA